MDAPTPTPRPDDATVAAAVSVLQAELALAHAALESIDRKAALLPPLLVGLGALIIPPGGNYAGVQLVAILAALVVGAWSVRTALRLAQPGETRLGPNASSVRDATTGSASLFQQGVAVALTTSVEFVSAATVEKGRKLRRATSLAEVAIGLVIAARLLGGLPMAADNPTPENAPPAAAPATAPAPSAEPASAPAAPAPAASALVGPSAPSSDAGPVIPNLGQQSADYSRPDLGQQLAERSANVPDLGQQAAAKGGPIPPDVERRIVEKGG